MSGWRSARRAPVRRRRSRRRRQGKRFAIAVALAGGVGLVIALVQWLLVHWWIPVAVGVLAAAAGAVWWQRKRWEAVLARGLRYQLRQLDALHHAQFERAVRDLLFRDGCADAARTAGGTTRARTSSPPIRKPVQ